MQIALLHDSVSTADAPDAQDVLVQADAVTAALEQLGHRCSRYGCGLNLEAALQELHSRQAELVFNLVESLAGQGRLIHLLPACLEAEDLPFTGSGALALLLSSNKLLAKERLQQAGIATPAWITPQSNAAVFCQNGKGNCLLGAAVQAQVEGFFSNPGRVFVNIGKGRHERFTTQG